MKKSASYGLTVLLVLVFTSLTTPASAAGAKVMIKVDREVVKSGQTFTVTAAANVRCQWLVQWNGERRVQTGKRFAGSFTAPAVDVRKRLPVRATCFWTPKKVPVGPATAAGGTTERIAVHVPERTTGAVTITVLPPGQVSPPQPPQGVPGGPGSLPNTGGPAWLLLLAGMISLLGGAVVLRRTAQRIET